MIDRICAMRRQIVSKIEGDIAERGLDRIDADNLGKAVDMVKDLAEAEEKLRKAEYYRLASEAMGGGYARETHPEVAEAIARALESAGPHGREALRGEVMAMLA